jgi:hypothetical protein
MPHNQIQYPFKIIRISPAESLITGHVANGHDAPFGENLIDIGWCWMTWEVR